MNKIPKREYFLNTLQALKELEEAGSNSDINNKVIEILEIPEKLLNIQHKHSSQTEFKY